MILQVFFKEKKERKRMGEKEREKTGLIYSSNSIIGLAHRLHERRTQSLRERNPTDIFNKKKYSTIDLPFYSLLLSLSLFFLSGQSLRICGSRREDIATGLYFYSQQSLFFYFCKHHTANSIIFISAHFLGFRLRSHFRE